MKRRDFMTTAAAAAAIACTLPASQAHANFTTKPKKALIGSPNAATMERWKSLGFDGMEAGSNGVSLEAAEAGRKISESVNFPIHSTLFGWSNVNTDDEARFNAEVAAVKKGIEVSGIYGASAILWVPCRIGGMAMPNPWDFKIDFDEKTNEIKTVVEGDNTPYQAYIDQHNFSMRRTRAALDELIPVAEKNNVLIAVENVWNNMWVQPQLFANFINSVGNRWVQTYFDIGNHVKYALPEQWFDALGKTIIKLHVKDFKLNANGQGGNFCAIRDGSVNWPLVRQKIESLGYNDYMTIEGGGVSEQEQSRRLDLILAGE